MIVDGMRSLQTVTPGADFRKIQMMPGRAEDALWALMPRRHETLKLAHQPDPLPGFLGIVTVVIQTTTHFEM